RLHHRRAARATGARGRAAARVLQRDRADVGATLARRGSLGGARAMTSDSIAANIAEWTEKNKQYTDSNAKRAWEHEGVLWGVFSIPEEQVGALPDVNGLDVVELGCGTAYFGSWLPPRGGPRYGR